jgi:hypothetical protein
MARTFGALLFYSAANLNLPTAQQGTAAGQYAWVRNGLGDVSLNNTAGVSTVQIWADLADYKRPYVTFPATPGQGTLLTSNEFQEVFGTAAGGPSNPFSGGATASQFGTPPLPWGVAVIDIFAVYSVQTAALTAATLGLNRATYTENTAFTNTAVVAATAIALTTTTGAGTPHVQKVTLAQPLNFEINDISNLNIELVITTAATSAVRVYGLGAHCAVEFG